MAAGRDGSHPKHSRGIGEDRFAAAELIVISSALTACVEGTMEKVHTNAECEDRRKTVSRRTALLSFDWLR